jgi:hypothetical protein
MACTATNTLAYLTLVLIKDYHACLIFEDKASTLPFKVEIETTVYEFYAKMEWAWTVVNTLAYLTV